MTYYLGFDDRDLFAKIKKGKFDIPSHVSEGARNLLTRILKVNPQDRPSVEQVRLKCGKNNFDRFLMINGSSINLYKLLTLFFWELGSCT